jgi:hypothetical protein
MAASFHHSVNNALGIRFLLQCLPPGWDLISLFNDDTRTEHADVIAVFDRAITHVESTIASLAEL